MSRRWQYLNFFGVLIVAALCVVQWRRDRQLNLDVNRLEKTRLKNEQKIAEQEKTTRGLTQDLERFKEQFKMIQLDLTETRQKLRTAESENGRLLMERDQLKESITNWAKAVAERDANIKEANNRIGELTDQLNDVVRKYNTLATNYNSVVKDLNDTRTNSAAKSASPSGR